MIDASTQTDLDATSTKLSSASSVSETMTGTKTPVIDVADQADPNATLTDLSSSSSLSETMTGTQTPSAHIFLQLIAAIVTSTVQEVLANIQPMNHEKTSTLAPTVQDVPANAESEAHGKTRQELADTKAEIAGKDEQIKEKDEEIKQYKTRLAEMTKSGDEQAQLYNEAKTQLEDANINIEELETSKRGLEERAASSQVEANGLRTALEEVKSRVSKLEVEKDSSQKSITQKDGKIKELEHDARETSKLSTKLSDRLQGAEGGSTLVRDDQSTRSKTHSPDVSTEVEVVSDIGLATVERPADHPATHQGETGHESDRQSKQPVKNTYSPADNNKSDGSGVEGTAVEEPRGNMRKSGKTGSVFETVASMDLSSSSLSSTAKGKQKEERSPAPVREGSIIFSSVSSEDRAQAEQITRYEGPEPSSLSINWSSGNPFKSITALPTGDSGQDEQEQEPTDQAADDRLLVGESASEGQVDSSQPPSTSGTAVARENDDYDILYDLEPGYKSPAQKRAEAASSPAASEGEGAEGDSTGVPLITITPPEDQVEVDSSNILERNGFDVTALTRVVGSGSSAPHETPEAERRQNGALERRNLEDGSQGAGSLTERLLPREGHYPSYEEATGIRSVVWHGRSRTAKEIHRKCEKGARAEDVVKDDLAPMIRGMKSLSLGPSLEAEKRMEGKLALTISMIERLHLGPSLPVSGLPASMGKVLMDDEAQSQPVIPLAAQPFIPLVSQPNESSSATIVDSTVQSQMELHIPSTAPLSGSSSSSSSSYPSTSVTTATTPPAAHEPREPERRSMDGNPMDRNGRLYLWHVWPLMRTKKPRVIG